MENTKRPSKGHMALTFCIGLAFIALVVWFLVELIGGIVSIFRAKNVYSAGVDTASISAASALSDALSAEKEDSEGYFQVLLSNLVMQDVPEFKKADDLDDQYIISFGLWQAISLNNSQGILAMGDGDQNYRIPKALVEKMASYYLPYTHKLSHQEVMVCGEFQYNKFNGTYVVPSSYPTSYLMPKVTKVEQNESAGTVSVYVDCYQYDVQTENPTENKDLYKKSEIYTLKKAENTQEEDQAVEAQRYTVISMSLADKDE